MSPVDQVGSGHHPVLRDLGGTFSGGTGECGRSIWVEVLEAPETVEGRVVGVGVVAECCLEEPGAPDLLIPPCPCPSPTLDPGEIGRAVEMKRRTVGICVQGEAKRSGTYAEVPIFAPEAEVREVRETASGLDGTCQR